MMYRRASTRSNCAYLAISSRGCSRTRICAAGQRPAALLPARAALGPWLVLSVLARVVARLFGLRYPNSPTDHAETMATYFSDPGGNGIELTFETPERGALALGDGRGVAIMADGSTQGPTEPLDVDDLRALLAGG